MAGQFVHIRHLLAGGWSTDDAPAVASVPDDNGVVTVPHLLEARNILYATRGGGYRKTPGTRNVSPDLSNFRLVDLHDYWRQGTIGVPVQQLILRADDRLYEAPGNAFDDNWTEISGSTGLNVDGIPTFSQFDDLLIYSDTSSVVPQQFDGVTWADLEGSPPNFAWSELHKNRLWAGGVDATPSRIFYSDFVNPQVWPDTADPGNSGFIDINPDDGDILIGARSFKDQLVIFKGPNKGSIHRIVGSSPTGSDAFALDSSLPSQLPAVSNRSIFIYRGDIGFLTADGNVHSLAATAAFGDLEEAALTRPIQTYLQRTLNFANLKFTKAETFATLGVVLFTFPRSNNSDGSNKANTILAMDYRFDPVRWALWDGYSNPTFASRFIDQTNNNRPSIMLGGLTGVEGDSAAVSRVYLFGRSTRSNDGTAIPMQVQYPKLNYAAGHIQKTLTGVGLGITPHNAGDIVVTATNELSRLTTHNLQQSSSAALDTFVLGTDILSDTQGFRDLFLETEDGGEFSSIQFEVTNAEDEEDVEVHSLLARFERGAEQWHNE